jgi:hydroxymethylglutaryl-CoA lyase
MRGSSLIKICISPSNSRPNKAFVRQSFRRCYNSSCCVRPNDTQNSVVSSLHVKRRKKRFVRVVEVGPRDGLQNESKIVPSSDKISFIQMLAAAGCPAIEAASFVSPRWVPTMADAATVMEGVRFLSSSSLALSCLVPNLLGCQRALMAGASELAVVISPSETFSLKNMNCSIKESLARCREVAHAATDIPLRGYVTCVWGCPFEGPVSLDQVTRLAEILLEMGCYQVSLGDTIGVGTPHKTVSIVRALQRAVGNDKLAVHFHDTYGQGVANTYAAVCEGIGTVDTSVGGLGGCPYAFGASGNVATEDVVYML